MKKQTRSISPLLKQLTQDAAKKAALVANAPFTAAQVKKMKKTD